MMSDWFHWPGPDESFAPAGSDAMPGGGETMPAAAPAPGGLLNWGQGGLFGGGASFGTPGMPNMGLLRFGTELMSPDPNAWSRAAAALRQGAAFDQKLRKEAAARAASGATGVSALSGGLDPLMLRLAALAETQREQAAAPPAPAPASSLKLPGNALGSGGRARAPSAGSPAGRGAGVGAAAVSQRPGPPLRIRIDAQGRRIG